ncbi:unnamed protein product [Caretta caretta]
MLSPLRRGKFEGVWGGGGRTLRPGGEFAGGEESRGLPLQPAGVGEGEREGIVVPRERMGPEAAAAERVRVGVAVERGAGARSHSPGIPGMRSGRCYCGARRRRGLDMGCFVVVCVFSLQKRRNEPRRREEEEGRAPASPACCNSATVGAEPRDGLFAAFPSEPPCLRWSRPRPFACATFAAQFLPPRSSSQAAENGSGASQQELR